MFWIFGLIILTINTFTDIYYFLKHLWIRDIFKSHQRCNH
jgi:hypothetical protein